MAKIGGLKKISGKKAKANLQGKQFMSCSTGIVTLAFDKTIATDTALVTSVTSSPALQVSGQRSTSGAEFYAKLNYKAGGKPDILSAVAVAFDPKTKQIVYDQNGGAVRIPNTVDELIFELTTNND